MFICDSITAGRYVDDVLQATLLPYINGCPQILFQQVNTYPYVAHRIMKFLQEAGVNVLLRQQHVWDMMGRRLSNLHHPPQTLAQLIQKVQEVWNEVPQADMDHLL